MRCLTNSLIKASLVVVLFAGCDGEEPTGTELPDGALASEVLPEVDASSDSVPDVPEDVSDCSSNPMRLYDASGAFIGFVADLGEDSLRVLVSELMPGGDEVLEFWIDSGRIRPMGDVYFQSDDCSGEAFKHWPEPPDINPPAVLPEPWIRDCFAQQVCRIAPDDAEPGSLDFFSEMGSSAECREAGLFTKGVKGSYRVSEIPTKFGYPLALPLEIRVGCDSFTLE